MKQFAIIFTGVFVSHWIIVHLVYAFVMLDWALFTEWEPFSRGMNLFTSLGMALTFSIVPPISKTP